MPIMHDVSPTSGPKTSPPKITPGVEEPSLRAIVHPAPTATKPAPQAPAKQSWWITLLILAVLGVGGYYAYPYAKPYLSLHRPPAPAPPPRVVPVVTQPVIKADVNLYLNGLGTVTSFKTVTIRSRIDGELDKVSFTEGQMVKQGDLLAEIDPRPYKVQLREAEAKLARDRATLKLALLDLNRYEAIASTKAVTQQQVDAQKALVQQSQATLDVDQSVIENVKLQLTYCKIIAPLDGRIGLRNVDAGNLVRANEPAGMAVITQLQPIAVVFTIPQDDIARVQTRMSQGKALAVEAFDRELKTKLATGKLAAIDNQVDATTGTVRLKAVFPNEDNLLFPNQFVNGRLLVDTLHDATVVPSAAVQRGPEALFAYVMKPDSTVELRKVTVGPTEGDRTVIESGLEVGDVVVVEGVDKLQPGTKVAPRGAETGQRAAAEPVQPNAPKGT